MSGLFGSKASFTEKVPIALNEGSFQGDHSAGGEQDAFNITGSGVLNYWALTKSGTNGFANLTTYLVVDGVTIFSVTNNTISDVVADFDKCYPNGIPFKTSIRSYCEWSSDPAGSDDEIIINWEIAEHS